MPRVSALDAMVAAVSSLKRPTTAAGHSKPSRAVFSMMLVPSLRKISMATSVVRKTPARNTRSVAAANSTTTR